jgi:hypothetical protein
MSLTVQELNEKIEGIKLDIDKLRGEPGSDRKIMFLSDYIDYLKDEIKEAERANRAGTSTK